jgi:hypothetical protein
MKNQKEKIIKQLLETGEVSNFWAIKNYILRLGALIHKLKSEGWEFEGYYGKSLGKPKKYWKNYYYKLLTK